MVRAPESSEINLDSRWCLCSTLEYDRYREPRQRFFWVLCRYCGASVPSYSVAPCICRTQILTTYKTMEYAQVSNMTKALAVTHVYRSQRSVRFAGLMLSCAFGQIRRLEAWPNQPQYQATQKAGTTVSSSSNKIIKTGDGQAEGSFPSPGPEQKIERSVAPIYNDKVVSVRDKYISSSQAARKWCSGTRCRSRVFVY